MTAKTIGVVLAIAAMAVAGWRFRDAPELNSVFSGIRKSLDAFHIDNGTRVGKDGKALPADRKDTASKAAGGLRKCVAGERVSYTDEACPPGSREAAISGGNVTVLPAQRTAPAADGDNASKSSKDLPQRSGELNTPEKSAAQKGGR